MEPSILCTVLLAVAPQTSRPQPMAGLSRVSVEPPLTWVIDEPGRVLRDVFAGLRDGASIEVGGVTTRLDTDEDLEAALIDFGVDLEKPATWARVGLDPDRPFRVSFADPGLLCLPRTIWLTCGVDDRELAQRFLVEVNGDLDETKGTPPIHRVDRNAWTFVGGQLVMLGTAEEKSDPIVRLRMVLDRADDSPTIGSDPLFRALAKRLPGPAATSMFLNIDSFREGATTVRAAVAAMTHTGLHIGIEPRDRSKFFGSTAPGGTCRDVLARFEAPVMAFSASLEEPLRTLLGAQEDGMLDRDAERAAKQMRLLIGEALVDQLRNSAIGVLLYPRDGQLEEPRIVACVKVQDTKAALESISQVAEDNDFELTRDGDWYRRSFEGEEGIFGAIGDCVVFSNAPALVQRAARAKQDVWQPQVGGADLFAVEADIASLALACEFHGGDEQLRALTEAGSLSLVVEPGDAGMMIHVRLRGGDERTSFARRIAHVIGALADW